MSTFTDCYGYSCKAHLWTLILEGFDKTVPSYRAAKLSVANLERAIQKFDRECTAERLDTMTEKKLRKLRGQLKRRVAQQDKIVDKNLRKLLEEKVLRDLHSFPEGKKIKAAQLRGAVQKRLAGINRDTHRSAQKALRASYNAVAAVLGGTKGS